MVNKELKVGWKTLSWIITATIMFLLGLLGIIIADTIGVKSRYFGYAGFLIGWSSYSVVKEILIRFTCKDSEDVTDDFDSFDEDIKNISSLNISDLSKEQKLTHEIRVSCQNYPHIWRHYIEFVSIALGMEEYNTKIQLLMDSQPQMSKDSILELIGSEYATSHILTDKEWAKNLRSSASSISGTDEDVVLRLNKYIQIAKNNIKSTTEMEEAKDAESIRIYARVGARTLWAGMYEITVINQIKKNK